ncbi:hypothetical protein AcV7_007740 [Taiwanofungus camphoratus]|nr:hypothetical protein AcV7_007740 [Antrodia cinnamomea]
MSTPGSLSIHPTIFQDDFSYYGGHIIDEYHRRFLRNNSTISKIAPYLPTPLVNALLGNVTGTSFSEEIIPVPPGAKVGIIGGGVGGLYAAMMLESLDIPYEVLEASPRVGGRLFTYRFSEKEYDYYDVGAMRFPHNRMMKRTFDLFKRLRLELLPYIFENENSTLLYNEILKPRSASNVQMASTFDVHIPPEYRDYTWSSLVDNVVQPFARALKDDLESHQKHGWELMMKYDIYSTRAYMSGNRTDTEDFLDELKKLPYPTEVVNWLETFDRSTGWYDQALTETVLESMAFAFPTQDGADTIKWFCVRGGSEVITDTMKKRLNVKPTCNAPAVSVSLVENKNDSLKTKVEVGLASGQVKSYAHVINTTTLPCLRAMDLTSAVLDSEQSTALRELQYGPATKIGVKFKTAWWEDQNVMKKFGQIVGGQSFTDRMVRTVVYPSYGTHGPQGKNDSTVLIVSYAWTSDSLRWGSLFGQASGAQLKEILLRDLAAVHGFDPIQGVEFLKEQWVAHHAWSWTNDPYTMGAYGFFGPGQFANVYQNLTRPAAKGRLHFGGETVSTRHAWVVGALDASWRTVREILNSSYPHLIPKFEQEWGSEEDWSTERILRQLAISMAGKEVLAYANGQ